MVNQWSLDYVGGRFFAGDDKAEVFEAIATWLRANPDVVIESIQHQIDDETDGYAVFWEGHLAGQD